MFKDKLTVNQIDNYINQRSDEKSDRLSDGMGLWLNITNKQTKQFRFDYSRPNTKSTSLKMESATQFQLVNTLHSH